MELSTTQQVIEKLGGVRAVATLTGRKYPAAWNWTRSASFPANTFRVMQRALAQLGLTAAPSLWGQDDTEPQPASGSPRRTRQAVTAP